MGKIGVDAGAWAAHYRQYLLQEGWVVSLVQIANADGIDSIQVRRMIRLTSLVSELVKRLMSTWDIVLEQITRYPWPNS